MPPALMRISGVELARVGTWNAATGPWTCTAADLADAVRAQSDPSFRTAILKIGHDDPRFDSEDGEPAVGRVENLRLSEDGQVLLGDLVGVPAWLAEMIPSAYPSRSIEAALGVTTESGQTYGMVLTGLALLGITPPAIQNLDDLRRLYEVSGDLDAYVAAKTIAASVPTGAPDTSHVETIVPETKPAEKDKAERTAPEDDIDGDRRIKLSAKIEELVNAVRAFATTKGLTDWAWVREVYTDKVILDDDMGRLWQVGWTEAGGEFTFADPVAVEVVYQPVADSVAARAAHSMKIPVLYVRGQVRAAVGDHDEQDERTAVPDLTDAAKAIREALGLPEDATEEQVHAAMLAKLTEAPPETDPTKTGDQPADSDAEKAGERELVSASAASEKVLARMGEMSEELATLKRERHEEQRAKVLASALADGKIKPADRAQWEADYDENPAFTSRVLARIAPGTAMTVAAKGRVGTPDDEADSDDEVWNKLIAPRLGVHEGTDV